MIEQTKNDINQRVAQGIEHFSLICSTGKKTAIVRAKGLAFVEMYAIHEYATTTAVRLGLTAIANLGIELRELHPGLLSLALHDNLRSIKDSTANQWRARRELFESLQARLSSDINVESFPADGTHYRRTQIETIWVVFGIKTRIVPDRRLLPLIDEVVEHRNAVAHGREKPEDIGGRYTSQEIKKKFRQIGRIDSHILESINRQCCSAKLICRTKTSNT